MRLNSVTIDGVAYPVRQYTSPNIGGAMTEYRGAVLHIAAGTYIGTIGWQLNPEQRYANGARVRTSSDLVVGKLAGEVAQMAPLERVTYTQRDGNGYWKSIEFAGNVGDKLTAWQLKVAAAFLVFMHKQYGVPVQISDHPNTEGLGHHSMGAENGLNWGHSQCPGAPIKAQKAEIIRLAKLMLAGQSIEEEDLTPEQNRKLDEIHAATVRLERPAGMDQTAGGGVPILPLSRAFYNVTQAQQAAVATLAAGQQAIMTKLTELAQEEQDESPVGGVTGEQIKATLEEFVGDLRIVSVDE